MTERLVAAALIGPWCACAAGWAALVAAHTVLSPLYRTPRRSAC